MITRCNTTSNCVTNNDDQILAQVKQKSNYHLHDTTIELSEIECLIVEQSFTSTMALPKNACMLFDNEQ